MLSGTHNALNYAGIISCFPESFKEEHEQLKQLDSTHCFIHSIEFLMDRSRLIMQ